MNVSKSAGAGKGKARKSGNTAANTADKGAAVRDFLGTRAKRKWSTRGPDPEYMHRMTPAWDFMLDRYFRTETTGWERLPDGPCLAIGIHSGTWFTMDAWVFVIAWWRRFGSDRILHGTAHDVLMAFPGIGPFFRNVGVIPASRQAVTEALDVGHSVVIWPGGEQDAMRAWSRRYEVDFSGRRGFVKQAILSGVPIVPVATVGGSDTVFVLSEGRWLAKALQFKKLLRAETAPIVAGLPFGIWPEILPSHLPLPAKITTEILDPIAVDADPDRVNDDAYVNDIYEQVRSSVQAGVQRLAQARKYPVFG